MGRCDAKVEEMSDDMAKYGVLPVQMPPVTPRYSHRNGEKQPPTVEGAYWFLGKYNRPSDWNYMFFYFPSPDMPNHVTRPDDEWEIPFTDLDGRWWGPVHIPFGDTTSDDNIER